MANLSVILLNLHHLTSGLAAFQLAGQCGSCCMASLLLLLPLLYTCLLVTPSSGSCPRSGSAALGPQEEQGGPQLTNFKNSLERKMQSTKFRTTAFFVS